MHDLILLAALREGPKHGWALKKLAGFLSGSGEMHNNLVYPLMKKFVREGWVRRRAEPGERGQTRSVYSLTRRFIFQTGVGCILECTLRRTDLLPKMQSRDTGRNQSLACIAFHFAKPG